MQEKVKQRFSFLINYLKFLGIGLLKLYLNFFISIINRIKTLTVIEIIFYLSILPGFALTIPGWRYYDIELNSEIIRHNISTNDFLIYLLGFMIIGLTGFIKILHIKNYSLINRILFLFGIGLNILFYILSIFSPARIAPVIEANYTIWFYLFGIILGLILILGVPGLLIKPSTHLKNSQH